MPAKKGKRRDVIGGETAEPDIIEKIRKNRKEPPLHKRKKAKSGGKDE